MWELVLIYITVGGMGLSGVLLRSIMQSRRRLRAWQDAAGACGLQDIEASGWNPASGWSPRLTAREGAVKVQIETCRNIGQSTRIVIIVPGRRGLSGVSMSNELYRPPEARKFRTGDEIFDSQFWVSGPVLMNGLLDAPTRRLLLGLNVGDWVEMNCGKIRVETSDENLQSVLPLALALSRRFIPHAYTAQLLSENARDDPEAGVRLQNLLLLIRKFPGKRRTAEALRTACSDPSPEIRLRAAKELGAEGRDVLWDLAESMEDDAVSAEALSALDHVLLFERARAILDHALDRRRIQTARVCLEALGRSGDPAAVDVLAEAMAHADGKIAAAAAVALGATGSPAAEPPLLLALQREDTWVAAADALARTGTAAAVLPLEEAAERSPDDQDLLRATRQAIAEIQSRLQGASPGQLSLAGAEAGQLSLAGSEVGQLSLAPSEAGQLSLATDPAGRLSPPPQQPGQLSIDGGKEG